LGFLYFWNSIRMG